MVARMVLAVSPFGPRSSNGLKTEKIAPWFEASVNVAPSDRRGSRRGDTRNRCQDVVHLPRHVVGSYQ